MSLALSISIKNWPIDLRRQLAQFWMQDNLFIELLPKMHFLNSVSRLATLSMPGLFAKKRHYF
jgi:hypothetical protein